MYKVLCFGIVYDIVGHNEIIIEKHLDNVLALKNYLIEQYPALKNLSSLLVAVNQSYAEDNTILYSKDEIALIPPVSGG